MALVWAALLGGAVGAVGVHVWDTRQPAPSPPVIDVRASLGANTGGLDGVHDGQAIVALTVVLLNASTVPLTLTAIGVDGPGAGFVASPAGGPSTYLPVDLPRGQFVNVRFGMSSDCALLTRPEPRVTLALRDSSGRMHEQPTRIPDLDTIWGQTLSTGACTPAH